MMTYPEIWREFSRGCSNGSRFRCGTCTRSFLRAMLIKPWHELSIWIAWRLPGNVQVFVMAGGEEMRNLRRTTPAWLLWKLGL